MGAEDFLGGPAGTPEEDKTSKEKKEHTTGDKHPPTNETGSMAQSKPTKSHRRQAKESKKLLEAISGKRAHLTPEAI